MTCEICGRVSLEKNPLCIHHSQALANLKTAFRTWQKASGINWEGYLEAISSLDETGTWVKEVIVHLMSLDNPEARTSAPS